MSNTCYDTKPAEDCPVCGGMYKGTSCEVCGYDGEVIKDKTGKDAIIRHCKPIPDEFPEEVQA